MNIGLKIQGLKWYTLGPLILAFCFFMELLFTFFSSPDVFQHHRFYSPVQLRLLLSLYDGFFHFVILYPIILISLKWRKSYLALTVLSGLVVAVLAWINVSAAEFIGVTQKLGDDLLYDGGNITPLGIGQLLLNPHSVVFLCSLYIFVQQRISKTT